MKICILAFFLFAFGACGSSTPQITIPPDADLKADVKFQGTGNKRTIEVSFYFSKPVAPGVKTEPAVEVVPAEDVRFNGEPLTAEVNALGRNIYIGQNMQVKPENLISATLNGKPHEGKAVPQTTLQSKSVTAVMTPK
jgi:hypothetical protein